MTENIFFTADTHFGHFNALKYCNRPFLDIGLHDHVLIRNWNDVVTKKDRIYHLGDFGLAPADYLLEILNQLNGQIYLIKGNHDRLTVEMKKRFVTIEKIKEIKIHDEELGSKQSIILCHYPLESWNKKEHGSIMLHGHCHGMMRLITNRLDVGVDQHDYTPISYNEIKVLLTKFSKGDSNANGL